MNWILRFAIAVVGLSVMLASRSASADKKLSLPEPPIPVRDMQVAAYSKAFAKRFNLPDPKPQGELHPPLHALRFFIDVLHIDPVLGVPAFGCTLQAYFDMALDVAYPTQGKTWARDLYMPQQQAWLDNKLGSNRLPDQIHIARQESLSYGLVAIASPNYEWNKPGVFGTHLVRAFDRELVPGISYYEIGLLCPRPATATSEVQLELWLKKLAAPDFRTERMDFDAFHKFPIPKAIFTRAAPWLAWYDDRLTKAGIERARIGRERQSGEQKR